MRIGYSFGTPTRLPSMPTLLIRNARCVATFDDARRELADASVFICDALIEAIGPAAALPQAADEVIDARGHLVMPGLVNTHHHMYQSLTRADSGRAGRRAVQLAARAVPDLGGPDPRDGAGQHPGGDGRAAAVGLHHQQRPPLHLPQRRAAGRQHRGRAADRHALRRHARQHERGPERQGGLPPDRVVETKTPS
jgi:hypothetical protein